MSESRSHIRIGVVSSSRSISAWQAQCLIQAMQIDQVELVLAVIESSPKTLSFDAENAGASGAKFIWSWMQRRVAAKLPALQKYTLKGLAGNSPIIDCNAIEISERSWGYTDDDIEKIRAADLDILIRFSHGRVEGDVLDSTAQGVWYFHFGEEGGRGRPPSFWEIYHGSLLSCCSLRRYGHNDECDAVLMQGRFKTLNASYSANLSQMLTQSSRLFAQLCRSILSGVAAPVRQANFVANYSESSEPSNFDCLILYMRMNRNKLTNFCNNLFVHRHWGLALSFSPIEHLWQQPDAARVALLPPPSRATFYADPFGFNYQEGLAILHERWSKTESQGAIACSFLDKESLDEIRRAPLSEMGRVIPAVKALPVDMKFPHHSSYPYIFDHEGEYYCVPETSEAARVSLYRFEVATGEWTHLSDIINGFSAVDSSIILYSGKWWLFCTNLNDNPNSHLYIWEADELLGPWKEHVNNPVKMDICSARPAGTPFVHQGALFRPAQDSSHSYGGSIVIQRVTDLSSTSFAEETCGDLKQLADNLRVDGMHTLSRAGDSIVLDYYKRAFLPNILVSRLKLYLQSKRAQ